MRALWSFYVDISVDLVRGLRQKAFKASFYMFLISFKSLKRSGFFGLVRTKR